MKSYNYSNSSLKYALSDGISITLITFTASASICLII